MYLVAGLGITGQSVLHYFAAQEERCLAFDTRESFDITDLQQKYPEVEFALGEVPTSWINQFETIILSPGISRKEPWVEALAKLGKQVIGDIELFARAVGAPVIAITGSNGKSTVTTMTGLALTEAGYKVGVGGNIGEPALNLLVDDNEYDVFVLELSSFQLETTYSLNTVSATVLNISEDHMDRYLDLEDYIQAKTKVFADTEVAVVPKGLSEQGLIHHAKVVHFGLGEDFIQSENDYGLIEVNGEAWLGHGDTPQVPVAAMKLQGLHHQLNALAMMALCQPFNVENRHFEAVLNSFSGLPHRTELVTVNQGISWINDSKGTNVGATITAIESLGQQSPGQLILIAGGVGKDADFSGLQAPIQKFCKVVVLFGRDQTIIHDAIAAPQENGVKIIQVDDLTSAVAAALENAVSDDTVLFSPACASFDQFTSFVNRGLAFVDLVHKVCDPVAEQVNQSKLTSQQTG